MSSPKQTVSGLILPAAAPTRHGLSQSLFQTNNDYGSLVARIALGVAIFPHGAQKALGWFGGYGFAGTMNFFTQQRHIPAAFAALAIAAEFLGALGLITGLLGRVAAFGIMVTMAVAALTAHLSNGFFMNWMGNQKGEGIEYFILAIGLAITLIINGSGALSLDRFLSARADR
ncbi:MAG: DoxX family protein [Candidatus Sericytochromatia bacterium]|nr:DoxX family protein [Candidatus Sericytochromatia bacterium]